MPHFPEACAARHPHGPAQMPTCIELDGSAAALAAAWAAIGAEPDREFWEPEAEPEPGSYAQLIYIAAAFAMDLVMSYALRLAPATTQPSVAFQTVPHTHTLNYANVVTLRAHLPRTY